MKSVGRVYSVQCVCNARHSHRGGRGGRRVACRWRVALLTLVCQSPRPRARPRMRGVACKTSALLREGTAATVASAVGARARCETHRCASSQPHTCCVRRARPIFTASARPSVVVGRAGVLRGSRAASRAMAMLDAAVHVLCAGLRGASRSATYLCCSLLIRACPRAGKRKHPYSGDVWDCRSTHLQGGRHGNARQGRERRRAVVLSHCDP